MCFNNLLSHSNTHLVAVLILNGITVNLSGAYPEKAGKQDPPTQSSAQSRALHLT